MIFEKYLKEYIQKRVISELEKFEPEIKTHLKVITLISDETAKNQAESITKLLVNHFKRLNYGNNR